MSIWDQFYQLNVLEIDFKDSLSTSAVIYGNGRNQVAISIHVRVMSSVTTVLPLTDQEIFDAIYLCNYRDGSRLSSDWQLSKTPGDYVGAVNYLSANSADSLTPGDNFLTCYLSCGKAIPSTLISLGIDIPGVGKFDTSEHGTTTLNGPGGGSGSVFKNPQNITISSLEPIDYGVSSNIVISDGWSRLEQMNLLSDKLPVNLSSDHSPADGSEAVFNKGKAYYRSLRISSKEGWPFVLKIINGNRTPVPGYNVVTRSGQSGVDILCGFNTRDDKLPAPVQVYDTSMVFIDMSEFGVRSSTSGGLAIFGKNSQYRPTEWTLKLPLSNAVFNTTIDRSSIAIAMLHVRHCAYFYTGETWGSKGWNNSPIPAHISVFDQFGNSGIISISVSENKDEIGRLIINGVSVAS